MFSHYIEVTWNKKDGLSCGFGRTLDSSTYDATLKPLVDITPTPKKDGILKTIVEGTKDASNTDLLQKIKQFKKIANKIEEWGKRFPIVKHLTNLYITPHISQDKYRFQIYTPKHK